MLSSVNESTMKNNNPFKNIGAQLASNFSTAAMVLFKNHFNDDLVHQWKLVVPDKKQLQTQKSLFIEPLLRLLINYCETNDNRLLAIYLDERLRYAPHRLPMQQRQEFHNQLVQDDFRALSSAGILQDESRDLWNELHQPLTSTGTGTDLVMLAVGDCLFNELRVFAPHEARKVGVNLDMRCIYFNAKSSGGIDDQAIIQYVKKNPVDLITFSFFSFDALAGYNHLISSANKLSDSDIIGQCQALISLVNEFIDNIRNQITQTIVIHNVSGLPLRRWRKRFHFLAPLSRKQQLVIDTLNASLAELASAKRHVLLMDEAGLAETKGLRNCTREIVSQKKYGGLFHTSHFGYFLTEPYNDLFSAYTALSRCKVLLVDFDNTLWKGVMADGDVTHFKGRQQLLKRLKDAGILLVAVSKNTSENIRWQEMILQQEDFALQKISWQTKVESIFQAADELNLGKDSFVFIDDNRHERIQIENELPDVRTLDAEDESTWSALEMMLAFPNTTQTEEARKRTEMYRQQAQRKRALDTSVDFASMMSKLDLWYRYYPATEKQMGRAHELVNRTNQFNTTTKRYSEEQMQAILESENHDIMLAEMGDKYGSLGIVSVIIIHYQNGSTVIDSFIMSCRAMGFGLENQLLYCVEQTALGKGASKIVGHYIATDRNQPCATLYSSNGYTADEDDSIWTKTFPSANQCKPLEWFTEKAGQ